MVNFLMYTPFLVIPYHPSKLTRDKNDKGRVCDNLTYSRRNDGEAMNDFV